MARAIASSRWKWVKVCRMPPSSTFQLAGTGASLSASRDRQLAFAPGARRHLVHAAQQALGRPLAQQHRAVLAHQHEGEAAPGRLVGLGRAARQLLGDALRAAAAALHQRADHAARIARRADRGAEIHHRLGVVAGALPAAPARRRARRSRSWRRAAASRSRRAGRSRARHCRRPPRPAGRRRWRGLQPPCSGRCRAGRAGSPRPRESGRHAPPTTALAQACRLRARA